jgi:hypothetical protein
MYFPYGFFCSDNFDPKIRAGFWLPGVCWAEAELPAHFRSPGKAKNAPSPPG